MPSKDETKRNSKVIRIDKDILSKLEKWKGPKARSWNVALAQALESLNGQTVYTLPSAVFSTQKEARQAALEIGAQQGLNYEEIEQPVKIKKVK